MNWPWQSSTRSHAELLQEVVRAIRQVAGLGGNAAALPVSPTALLGANLGLSSLAVARLAGLLLKRFDRKSLPFQKLLIAADGAVLNDIRVSDLVDFLERELRAPP